MTPLYALQGWMRGKDGIWKAVCAGNCSYDCFLIMRKLQQKAEWSSSVVLPFMETPAWSQTIQDGGF